LKKDENKARRIIIDEKGEQDEISFVWDIVSLKLTLNFRRAGRGPVKKKSNSVL